MENVADALKMAAAALIFVVALAVSFSLFGTAKETADSIIGMRNKQQYLESADLDTVLYTSSSKIQTGNVSGFTSNGDRIVKADDIYSTIYRYNKEKYGVTLIRVNGDVIARFDSNTENIMRQWNNIATSEDGKTTDEQKTDYVSKIKENISTSYITNINLDKEKLEKLYEVTVTGNSKIHCGAPWYGNDLEILKRINADIEGKMYNNTGQKYNGKNLKDILTSADRIVEVTNEIDRNKYLKDKDSAGKEQITDLLQQYNMPTVEVIYIIYY